MLLLTCEIPSAYIYLFGFMEYPEGDFSIAYSGFLLGAFDGKVERCPHFFEAFLRIFMDGA